MALLMLVGLFCLTKMFNFYNFYLLWLVLFLPHLLLAVSILSVFLTNLVNVFSIIIVLVELVIFMIISFSNFRIVLYMYMLNLFSLELWIILQKFGIGLKPFLFGFVPLCFFLSAFLP